MDIGGARRAVTFRGETVPYGGQFMAAFSWYNSDMKIEVMVKPGSKGAEGVTVLDDGSLVVRMHARAHDGEANLALRSLLADYYGVSKGLVRVVRGEKARRKVVEIG